MVDADPQCNLTGMVLDLGGIDALEHFYADFPGRNLREALEPAFAARPKALEPVECVPVDSQAGLYLLPGHVGLAEDEVSLGIAQQLSESVQALKNLPGSFRHLFEITAEKYDAEYVLLDLSPGLGSINQNLVASADFFIVPASPDVFSVMAIDSLSRVIPRWIAWADRAGSLETLANADYPFVPSHLKFLGLIVQRYRLRSGQPTKAFQDYFDKLETAIQDKLIPAFEKSGVLLPAQRYADADLGKSLQLAAIPDFNTLIAHSQKARKPIYALSAEDVEHAGIVWEIEQQSIASFREIFETLAQRIELLTAD